MNQAEKKTMKRPSAVLVLFILSYTLLFSQRTNYNISISPWVFGQVKVKYEFTSTNKGSYGSYLRISWESLILQENEILREFTANFRGIRFEPFMRIYFLPMVRPLHGFYFQLHGLFGIYQDLYVYSWDEDSSTNPFLSAGFGFKVGFQSRGVISNDIGFGLKLHWGKMEDVDWFDGPGFPVMADFLIGYKF
ncbi:hypothetical protein ACFLTU_08715 [Bacteroidota bacterium]